MRVLGATPGILMIVVPSILSMCSALYFSECRKGRIPGPNLLGSRSQMHVAGRDVRCASGTSTSCRWNGTKKSWKRG